jgi:hypothetical protein
MTAEKATGESTCAESTSGVVVPALGPAMALITTPIANYTKILAANLPIRHDE